MPAPRFGTVAVVVSTAVLTAALTTGGPAIAASVVDFAKNAGAVDGKSAVAANAGVNQRKGKLVATGPITGQLPNNIIAQAPDSAKLGGIPLSGLAPALLHATATVTPTTVRREYCQTKALTTTTASVANVEGELEIGEFSKGKLGAVQMSIDISIDGGTSWSNADGGWTNIVAASGDAPVGVATVAHVTTVAVPVRARLRFALGLTAGTDQVPDAAACSLTASVLHRTPGTVVSTTVTPSTTTPGSGRLFGRER